MSKFRDIDLWWTANGDLQVSRADLKDTRSKYGAAILQEAQNRLSSEIGDWQLFPTLGTRMLENLGEPNTDDLSEKIQEYIADALTRDGFLSTGEFSILSIPFNRSLLIIRVLINSPQGELTLDLGYDSDKRRFIGY